MSREAWKEMRRWQKAEAAVPLSERFIQGAMWVLVFFLVALSEGYQGVDWFFILAIILVFPGLPLFFGILDDYGDAKRRIMK